MNNLNVKQVIEKAYDSLVSKYCFSELEFSDRKAAVEIGDRGDHHRPAYSYLMYDKVHFLDAMGEVWIIGRGELSGYCPGWITMAETDIFALNASKEASNEITMLDLVNEHAVEDTYHFREVLRKIIFSKTYFKNSLIQGKTNGELEVSEDSIFQSGMNTVLADVDEHTARAPDFKKRVYRKYSPGIVPELVGQIETIFNSG